MSYTITRTNGTILGTIADGTYDNSHTSLTLVGRNYSNYGQIMTNNLVKLLENSSYSIAPSYPLSGQLWWDTANNLLKVYTGSTWKNVGSCTSQASAPSTIISGDLWWDTTNQQLYIYNGTNPYDSAGWILIGPSYSAAHKTGAIVEIIADNLANNHYVVSLYVDNVRTGIVSNDVEFTPATPISGFTTLRPGYNMSSNDTFWGTANNASYLGNQPAANYFRTNIDNLGTGKLTVENDLGVIIGATSQLTVSTSGTDASIVNNALNGNINLVSDSTTYLQVNGISNTIEVHADPSTTRGVATKNYVDNKFTNSPALGGNPTAPTASVGDNDTSIATTAFVQQANIGLKGYVDSVKASSDNDISYLAPKASPTLTGTPLAPTPLAGSPTTQIATFGTVIWANVGLKGYVDAADALKAPLASPTLTGSPLAPTAGAGTNTTQIATTAFVYEANVGLKNYVDTIDFAINQNIVTKANIASPTFTGDPKAPTPAVGDNDTSIATTAFVYQSNVGLKGYTDTALALKAPIASPALTGLPSAPTAAAGTNTTQIATTAFVYEANVGIKNYIDGLAFGINDDVSYLAPKASPALTGNPTAPTPSVGDNDTSIATTAFVYQANVGLKGYIDAADALKAPLANPLLTGNPQAPTATVGNNSSTISTTGFVYQANVGLKGYVDDAVFTINQKGVTKANIASPTLTGTPAAPTASAGTNTTQLATTAFVYEANVGLKNYTDGQLTLVAPLASPTFTGMARAVTMPTGTANTTIATTEFVAQNLNTYKITQGGTWVWVEDNGVGTANIVVDNTTVLTATSTGVSLSSGAVAVTQTQSASGTGNATIATTQYVKSATQWWGGSAKFVSTSAPGAGDGNNGDFWFQLAV